MFGEEGGWAVSWDALHENISPLHPLRFQAVQAGGARRGSRSVSRSRFRGAKSKAQGAPIDINRSVPKASAGDMEATAIVKGTQNLEAAMAPRRLVGQREGPT